jgi:dTDP-4-dehydrorhamnose reductase
MLHVRSAAERMSSATILVTGANGQLGHALRASVDRWKPPDADVFFTTRAEMDMSDVASVRACVERMAPRLIINAAAYTAVDRAESDADTAMAVNADAPRVMSAYLARTGGALVHISTDYVFDGASPRPYPETAPTHPLNVYGRTKLAGEEAVRTSGAAHWILRTSWVYSASGANFLKTIIRLAETKESISIVADQRGAPTGAKRLASFIVDMLAATTAEDRSSAKSAPAIDSMLDRVAATPGTYHATASGATTWHGYADYVVRGLYDRKVDGGWKLVPEAIRETTTADYPTPARRPLNSLLDHERFIATFGIVPPPWQHDVDACLDELLGPVGR